MKNQNFDGRNKAKLIASLAVGKKAIDTVILDLQKISNFCDFFVITEGESGIQLKAIADGIINELEKNNISIKKIEGDGQSGWILVDASDVMVHIFSSEARKFYNLERLWHDAKTVKLP